MPDADLESDTLQDLFVKNITIRHLLIAGFIPLVFCVLGADSQLLSEQKLATQTIADILAIIYFFLMVLNLRREEQVMALIFVPFSAVAEYLFSLIFGLYTYRLEAVPLYVPFGHGILFTTGLLISELSFLSKSSKLKPVLLCIYTLIFSGVIVLFQDIFSGLLGCVFLWVLQRKGCRLLYLIMGILVLYIELLGTSLGCWTWHPLAFEIVPTTNPPFGAFIFYVLGDLGVMKLSRWINNRFNLDLSFIVN